MFLTIYYHVLALRIKRLKICVKQTKKENAFNIPDLPNKIA